MTGHGPTVTVHLKTGHPLLCYSFDIRYKRVADNFIADAMSRIPITSRDLVGSVEDDVTSTVETSISKK